MENKEPATRSTYVDADEAAMRRAMARIGGGNPTKQAGIAYSEQNRARINARGPQAPKPLPCEEEVLAHSQALSSVS